MRGRSPKVIRATTIFFMIHDTVDWGGVVQFFS